MSTSSSTDGGGGWLSYLGFLGRTGSPSESNQSTSASSSSSSQHAGSSFSANLASTSTKPLDGSAGSPPVAATHVDPAIQTPAVADPLTPIQFEHFAREYMQISQQDTFDGFRLEASKSVSPHLQASHSLFLGTSLREAGQLYQFGPSFALDNGKMFIMSRYGNDGVMNARIMRKFGSAFEGRASAASSLDSEQRNMLELALDHSNVDWASSIKAAWQGTWMLNGTFSQVLSPKLQMGADLTWIAAHHATIGTAGFRYASGRNVVTGNLTRQPDFKSPTGLTANTHQAKLQYYRKISDRLSLGTELEIAREPETESALRVAWEYLFRQARVQGAIDTAGKVSMSVQEMSGFGMSGAIDYVKGDYKFGFMFQLVPPEAAGRGGPPPPGT